MEYFNGIACVSGSEFIRSFENPSGVVTKGSYDKLAQRGRIRVVRRSSYQSPALIDWTSIPDRYKAMLQEQGISPAVLKQGGGLDEYIVIDDMAHQFFSEFQLPDGRFLAGEKRDEYIANAEVLTAVVRVMNDRRALRKALGGSVNNLWPAMAQQVEQITARAHNLPVNPRRLRDKVSEFKKQGYICLVSGKFLNANAKKVADQEQEATIRQLLRKHQNLDNEQVKDLYNMVADKLGWAKISASTVANYRKKWQLDTYGGQRGESAFDNAKSMLVKRKAPTLPLVYWTMDGWDVELLYQKNEMDAKGNTRTTYHNRLTVVVVLDPCNKYPVGFAIGTHETPALIREALRNAVNHTAILFGERHRVLQLQTDNYGKKTLTPLYEALSEKYTPAKAHNAKAKIIEPYFKRLNKKYCQLMNNWSGFGVTADKTKQPNADYLNKIRHSFPDEAGCRLQIERIIELERAASVAHYTAAYKELPTADRKLLPETDYLHYLGDTTGYTNRLQHNGIVATIGGEKREYDTFDKGFRRLAHVDWTLKFDPDRPDRVLAENADGTVRYMLESKHVQPMALYDRQEGDAGQLQQVREFNKEMKQEIMGGMKHDYQLVDRMFNDNPALSDTLAKFVLVDSRGQHKDNKSAARLAAPAKHIEGTLEKAAWDQAQEEYLDGKIDLSKYI